MKVLFFLPYKRGNIKNAYSGSGEMALRLSVFDALAEDPGSVPSTHVVTHNQFQGIQCPRLVYMVTRHVHSTHNTFREKVYV